METIIFIDEVDDVKYTMNFEKITNLYYPHFIAEYGEYSVKVALDLSIIEGVLPDGKIHGVINWVKENRSFLESMWGKLIKRKINHLIMKKAV